MKNIFFCGYNLKVWEQKIVVKSLICPQNCPQNLHTKLPTKCPLKKAGGPTSPSVWGTRYRLPL